MTGVSDLTDVTVETDRQRSGAVVAVVLAVPATPDRLNSSPRKAYKDRDEKVWWTCAPAGLHRRL